MRDHGRITRWERDKASMSMYQKPCSVNHVYKQIRSKGVGQCQWQKQYKNHDLVVKHPLYTFNLQFSHTYTHMWNLHNRFHNGDLVLIINLAAGLSIFFFGVMYLAFLLDHYPIPLLFHTTNTKDAKQYDQGVMSGVNISPDYINVMGLRGRDALLGAIVAVYYFGTLIGALMGGWIGDKIGRIRTVVVGSLIAILGAILQTAAQNVAWMMASRIITGIGTGHLYVF